ncbi:RNA polymerase Rpb4 [Candidatus Bathyarchaeota archaeon]|nr:MAG: RNA polymerase Rpb4 [Candidatus Bathyarchaeota archaeon]
MSVIKRRPITIPEAKKLLEEGGEEMGPLQRRVLDYTTRFSKLDFEEAVRLVEELVSEVGLERETAVQIANCLPRSQEEIRTILGRQKIISEEDLTRILEIIKRHAG